MEDWKIKIAALWLVFEFCVITTSMILASIPMGIVAETTPEEILAVVVSLLIPPIMAFLSLTLKDKVNRWLNIILGIFFVVAIPFGTGFELIPAAYLPPVILTAIVSIVALILIIWYAWKSRRKA